MDEARRVEETRWTCGHVEIKDPSLKYRRLGDGRSSIRFTCVLWNDTVSQKYLHRMYSFGVLKLYETVIALQQ
jgi:hypothetical protein